MSNQQKKCTNKLLKEIEKRKVNSSFQDNICGADLEDMQLISKFN